MSRRTLYGTVIVTYRCNARCNMCDCFKDPTKPDEEITLEDIFYQAGYPGYRAGAL